MPARMEELEATVSKITFEWGDPEDATLILLGSAKGPNGAPRQVSLKGRRDNDHPQPHLSYRFWGRWGQYTNSRSGVTTDQFTFQSFVPLKPLGRAGVITYLQGAPGIGKAIAGQLWQKFHDECLEVLRTNPAHVSECIPRLTLDVAMAASRWLEDMKAMESLSVEMIELLSGRGFPRKLPSQLIEDFGNRAPQIIRNDPYLLLKYRGCGFKRCDAMYLELGHPPEALRRQALCAWYHLHSNTEGHTWHYRAYMDVGLKGAIGGAEVKPDEALAEAVDKKLLITRRSEGLNGPLDWDGSHQWVAVRGKALDESRVADYVSGVMAEAGRWPDLSQLADSLTNHQLEVLSSALSGPLAILGGGPGTGKTYTVAHLIKHLLRIKWTGKIGIMAPTGKAAVRISEAMSLHGLRMHARTIHSTLRVESVSAGLESWKFIHDGGNPWPFGLVVVDEASMIDTSLLKSLLVACQRGCHILLVGDVKQLAPVGHGAPLRDMIAAGVPYGEFQEVQRNCGQIVTACHQIRNQQPFDVGGNLIHVSATGDAQIAAVLETVKNQWIEHGHDPLVDVQVLCAVNNTSPVSRKELNRVLQANLNRNEPTPGSPFRVFDKVVNLKNGWFPPVGDESDYPDALVNDKGGVYVANGELGFVTRAEPKFAHVELQSPYREVVVPHGGHGAGDDSTDEDGGGCSWDLGYALSVHKSQGSEWPAVVVVVDESNSASRVCSREWLYTAISRAQERCYLIGNLSAAQAFCRRTSIHHRKTFLANLIRGEQ